MHDVLRFRTKRRLNSWSAVSLRSHAKAGKLSKFILHFIYISGYGHSTPTTIYGKLFTMCYAIIGIPLGLVMFQSIGERVNKFSSVVIRSVKTLLNCRNVQVTISLFEPHILSLNVPYTIQTGFRHVLSRQIVHFLTCCTKIVEISTLQIIKVN